MKEIYLKNNLSFRNRPSVTLICIGAPKNNKNLKNNGDNISNGEGLNKGDNSDEEEEYMQDDVQKLSIA